MFLVGAHLTPRHCRQDNLRELLQLREPKPVTLASIAARDAQQIEDATAVMHKVASAQLDKIRSQLSGGPEHPSAHGPDVPVPPVGAAGVLASQPHMHMHGHHALPQEVPLAALRARVVAMRAQLLASRAWQLVQAETAHGHSHGRHGRRGDRGGGGDGHGHSHGEGEHHSH
jgi:hypothetical protein